METVPLCFFPTEVVFIDDSEIYLQTLSIFCENHFKHLKLKSFSNPQEALEYISSKPKPCFEQFFQTEDTFCSNCYAMKLNVFALHKMIYNPNRFSQVSVILADYNLNPNQMNGVEFCKKINDKTIQKILFTAETDRDFVIEAFNENYIQKYVSKQEVRNLETIIHLILQAQERYFFESTKSIQIALKEDSKFPLAIYSNVFQSYFRDFLQKNTIREYFLLDAVGSFLMIDANNQLKILIVQNEDQCRANYLEKEDEIDVAMKSKLKAGEVIYCNSSFWMQENKNTKSFFIPAECIQDTYSGAKFYCACLENIDFIDASKVAFNH